MQPVEYAVIASAGLGSRLGHGLPKSMLEINGRTVLSRLIESLRPHVKGVRVVVGYREDLVIGLCASLHRDVVIVRNPEFRTTNTVQSMAMGARGLSGKVLFLDGDLIVEPGSLSHFIAKAADVPSLVAVAPSRSENPVNVVVDGPESRMLVTRFTRDAGHPYEWANVVAGPADMMDGAEGYVFQRLEEHLPLDAALLDLREVDTPADLELAKAFALQVDEQGALRARA